MTTRTIEGTTTVGTPEVSGARRGARVPARDPIYLDILDHLDEEALLLDHDDLTEWQQLLAPDYTYKVPVRLTRRRGEGLGFDDTMYHVEDDYTTTGLRIARLTATESGWAEDPPSRMRRYVTNVRVHRAAVAGEFEVTSYLLALRNRWDNSHSEVISGERQDLLRQLDGGGFQLARRVLYLDQSTLGTPNLAVFL
ncbi:aromatic-ring-hydroxylating dioxygenase subunit beta [Parafrankia elaeagni]|uniref:aromatic-ring-hydroxylating dioxygenase subunit beta n=1 Tax=Parafrankia elaeagni TaxID=222534 RepID=UPI00037A6C8E|nr:aromatic-ring-hydroxylating dioxygenase subunit beta [Parafrankia elaeagni]